jgi:hypothetical protein
MCFVTVTIGVVKVVPEVQPCRKFNLLGAKRRNGMDKVFGGYGIGLRDIRGFYTFDL